MIQAETINLSGTKAEKTNLPQKIFGAKINPLLMAQAVRVFLSNQRKAHASAKTRGEVERTKAKWYRQKGTGRARHGARSAPIFVGGGKAHGPTGEQNYQKDLPKKMRKAALLSALSAKTKDKEMMVIGGLEKVKKTKEIASLLAKIDGSSFLLVLSGEPKGLILACRNISNLKICQADSLNTYEVLNAEKILISKEALKDLEELWKKD